MFFAILLIGNVSAGFSLGNASHSIDLNYAPSSNVVGWLNMSFNQEPINSFFSLGFNNRIELLELINLNNFTQGGEYTCVPSDCNVDYESVGTG